MVSVSLLMAFEDGALENDEVIALFQELIDSGEAWTLQGHYGRWADALINAGVCVEAKHV